ncbi:hypothetical protein LUTEI9C_70417 [Luteimonas sp. 9C]|nr:hypothetical protein LUTEI9C_70417 [Luteimonas sp. 9C]
MPRYRVCKNQPCACNQLLFNHPRDALHSLCVRVG